MHHAPIVHHGDSVAERLRDMEVLLDQQDRGIGRLQFAEGATCWR